MEAVLLILAILAAVGSATAAGVQGAQANEEAKAAAKAEKQKAISREQQRTSDALRVLSAQRLGAIAAGVEPTSGSQIAIERNTDLQSRLENAADIYDTSASIASLRRRGRAALFGGVLGGVSSAIGSAADIYASSGGRSGQAVASSSTVNVPRY